MPIWRIFKLAIAILVLEIEGASMNGDNNGSGERPVTNWTGTAAQVKENSALDVGKPRETPFAILLAMWTFPCWYLPYLVYSVFFVASSFKTFGRNIEDFIPFNALFSFVLWLPVALFACIAFKYNSLLKHLLYLPFLWIVFYSTMGLTQGAIGSALSKAYSAGTEIGAYH